MEEVSPMSVFSAGPTGLSAPVSAVTVVLPTSVNLPLPLF